MRRNNSPEYHEDTFMCSVRRVSGQCRRVGRTSAQEMHDCNGKVLAHGKYTVYFSHTIH